VKFKFPTHEKAEAFAWVIGIEDELDLAAFAEGDEVEVLGVDDHELMVNGCVHIAEASGGVRIA
jgi:hypothetical protein